MKRNDARFVVFCFATAPVVVLFDLYLARKCFGGDRGEKSAFRKRSGGDEESRHESEI
jgi:hypothetical protein